MCDARMIGCKIFQVKFCCNFLGRNPTADIVMCHALWKMFYGELFIRKPMQIFRKF